MLNRSSNSLKAALLRYAQNYSGFHSNQTGYGVLDALALYNAFK
jgi:hypothetical protein